MNRAKLVASMLAIAATVGTAHAAQVMDASCAEVHNGTFGEIASHQPVICANGKWQDAKTVPVASVGITKYTADKKFAASYAADSYVGTRHVQQNSDGHGQFTLFATVVAFNPDDTAHVVIDFDDAGWQKHVDETVPVDAATAIATDNNGAEYCVTVKRIPA